MSSIIDSTYFQGQLSIAQKNDASVSSALSTFINDHEEGYLLKLLGYELRKALLDEQATGSELAINGDFSTNANNWNLGDGWSYNSGKVTFVNNSGPASLYQLGVLDTTKKYRISFDVINGSGFIYTQFGLNRINAATGTNVYEGYWANVLGHGGITLYFMPTADFDGSIDNISIKEITNQRWLDILNGKEYEYGSITKKWNGLRFTQGGVKKSPVANYVYCKWIEDQVSATTGSGEKKISSKIAVDYNPSQKICRAWNEMVPWNKNLFEFMNVNSEIYPEWILNYSNELVHPINPWGI